MIKLTKYMTYFFWKFGKLPNPDFNLDIKIWKFIKLVNPAVALDLKDRKIPKILNFDLNISKLSYTKINLSLQLKVANKYWFY